MSRQSRRSKTSARPPPRWNAAKLSDRPSPRAMGKFSIGALRRAARQSDRSKSHVPSSGHLKTDFMRLKQRLSSRDIINSLKTLEGIEERLRVVLRHTPTDTDLLIFQFDRGRNESARAIAGAMEKDNFAPEEWEQVTKEYQPRIRHFLYFFTAGCKRRDVVRVIKERGPSIRVKLFLRKARIKRRPVPEWKRMQRQQIAAKSIQRNARGMLERARILRNRREGIAVKLIQRNVRGMLARTKIIRLRREDAAIRVLQRWSLRTMRAKRARVSAAILRLQTFARRLRDTRRVEQRRLQVRSATMLQSNWRGAQTRRHLIAYVLQQWWCASIAMQRARRDWKATRAAVCTIQRVVRWRMRRKCASVTQLAAKWRSHKTRELFVRQKEAVSTLQRVERGRQARKVARHTLQEKNRHAGAVIVQSSWRRYRCSWAKVRLHDARRVTTLVQALLRGATERVAYRDKRRLANRMQCLFRLRRRRLAAIFLQRVTRGAKARAAYRRRRSAALCLQRWLRAVTWRRRCDSRYRAAIRVQRHVRGHMGRHRCVVKRERITKSQAVARRWSRRRRFKAIIREIKASKLVQRRWRGFWTRKMWAPWIARWDKSSYQSLFQSTHFVPKSKSQMPKQPSSGSVTMPSFGSALSSSALVTRSSTGFTPTQTNRSMLRQGSGRDMGGLFGEGVGDDDFDDFSDPNPSRRLHSLGATTTIMPNSTHDSGGWLGRGGLRRLRGGDGDGSGAGGGGGGNATTFGASNFLQPRRTSFTAPANVGRNGGGGGRDVSSGEEKPRIMARLDAAVAWGRRQKHLEDEAATNLVTNESHFVGKKSYQSSAKAHSPWLSRSSDAGAGVVRRPALPWQQLMMNAGNAAFRRRGNGRRHRADGDEFDF